MKPDKEQKKSLRIHPGAAIDKADDDRVTEADVKERTHTLGYNPRNKK